jgi:hypothetical protein
VYNYGAMIRHIDHGRVHPPLAEGWPPYSDADFERIAAAIGKPVPDICSRHAAFENAALWYQLDVRSPKRVAPSAAQAKLKSIAGAARKLLYHLGIRDLEDAPDGPGDITIFDALASVDGQSEDSITHATGRLGWLVEVLESENMIEELARTAESAESDAERVGRLIVPREHRGDAAANDWLRSMMHLYKGLTGKEPGASVKPPGANRGDVGGPFIRFLEAASRPIGIEYSSRAWRRRIRTALEQASPKKIKSIWPFPGVPPGLPCPGGNGKRPHRLPQCKVSRYRRADRARPPAGAPGGP